MKILCADIETIPCQSLPIACIPQFDSTEVKTGNIKDPVKIEDKINEARKEWAAGLSKKMSLDPAFAQLCTFVGITYDTEKEEVVEEKVLQLVETDGHDDLELVGEAWTLIQKAYHERTPLITFNGLSFDLPVLFMRAIKQDFPLDRVMINRIMGRKYQDNSSHYDLMQILAGWDRTRWHSFDFYSRLFNLGDKEDFDGAMVYPAYQAKEFDKIRDYCRKEVLVMCRLFTRLEPWIKYDHKEGA